MSSLTEPLKFAQLSRKPKSATMVEKQEILKPLIKSVFPNWRGNFIDNSLLNSTEVMMRKGDRFVHVVFKNGIFLTAPNERDASALALLQNAKQKYEVQS